MASTRFPVFQVSYHVRVQWQDRGDPDRDDLRAVWREADPVDYPSARNGAYARYHAPTDTVLLARQGALVTCIELSDRPRDEQRHVRTQVSD